MKLSILSKDNKATGTMELPKQFSEPVRLDLIKRAVHALQSTQRQAYGAKPDAGKRPSVRISKRRHDYRATYGIGQSRTPRKVMSYRGSRFNWTGAFAPQTVGGRRAHPPKASKDPLQKINDKERHKAIRSALSATMDKEIVAAHGYKVPDNYPFLIDESVENLTKTAEVKKALATLGFTGELQRAHDRKIRPGKGKARGRKYRTKTSVLFVVAGECPLRKGAANVPGVTVATLPELNAQHLAPGAVAGRATLYSAKAIEAIKKGELYSTRRKAAKQSAEAPKRKAVKQPAEKPKAAKKEADA